MARMSLNAERFSVFQALMGGNDADTTDHDWSEIRLTVIADAESQGEHVGVMDTNPLLQASRLDKGCSVHTSRFRPSLPRKCDNECRNSKATDSIKTKPKANIDVVD